MACRSASVGPPGSAVNLGRGAPLRKGFDGSNSGLMGQTEGGLHPDGVLPLSNRLFRDRENEVKECLQVLMEGYIFLRFYPEFLHKYNIVACFP